MPVLKNARHEAYCQARAKGMSIDDAYIEAGFKANRGNAARLNAYESVQRRVAEIMQKGADRAEVDIARVLKELGRLATSDIRDALDEDGNLKPPSEWGDDFAAAVSSIEVVTKALPGEADEELDGQPHGGALKRNRNPRVEYVHKIKVWDKNSALEKLAKAFGMFVEKMEVSGPGGGPMETVTRIELVGVEPGEPSDDEAC